MCILAAGLGSRLKQEIPKAMVNITAEYTILDLQIQNLRKMLEVKLDDIIVVAGYKKQLIKKRYPDLSFVYNDDYHNTCTAKSLLKCLEIVENSDVLWINGDVVFESDILNLIIENKENNLVLVDNKHTRKAEIKYTVDEDGFLKKVSKNLKNGIGELIGINFVKQHTLPILVSNLERSADLDYFDRALQETIKDGFKFIPINIQNRFSIEIDYPYELETAKKWAEQNLL